MHSPSFHASGTTDRSLSSSLQRINKNDQAKSESGGSSRAGFLSFITTPWKKRKRDADPPASDATEEPTTIFAANEAINSNDDDRNGTYKKARLRASTASSGGATVPGQTSLLAVRRFQSSRRRPRVTANFRPMCRSLTDTLSRRQRLELDRSLISQILEDKQRTLKRAQTDVVQPFADAPARSAPRVHMRRVLGANQSGGRLAITAPSRAEPPASAVATPAKARREVTFQSPPESGPEPSCQDNIKDYQPLQAVASTEPFVAKSMSSTRPITHLDPQTSVPKVKVQDILRKIGTPEWQTQAQSHQYGFGDDALTPAKKKRGGRSTPHPKKSQPATPETNIHKASTHSDVSSTTGTTTDSGAPFGFMPQQPPNTPAYKYDPATEKSLQKKDCTEKPTAPIPSSGWGDLFKSQPGEWKCNACYVKNKKEDSKCVSCETLREQDADHQNETKEKNDKVDSSNETTKGSIGATGFSFGGEVSSSNGSGFSFGALSNSSTNVTAKSEPTSQPIGFTFGGTKADSKEKSPPQPASKAAPSTGFSFGVSADTATKAAESSSTGKFSFKSAEEKNKDDPIPAVAFGSQEPSSTKTSSINNHDHSSSFVFGSSNEKSATSNTSSPQLIDQPKTKPFEFGSTSTPSIEKESGTTMPSFSFGQSTPAPKTNETAGLFSFGSAPPPAAEATKPTFSFGATKPADDTKQTTSALSFGATQTPPPPAVEATKPTFSFGATKPDDTKQTTPALSFGATQTPPPPAAEATKSTFSFGATKPADDTKRTTPALSFGATQTPNLSTPAIPALGGQTTSELKTNVATGPENPKPAFSFGAAAQPSAPTTSGFSFGSTQPAPAPPASIPGVPFGAMTSTTPSQPSATPGFTFGGNAAATNQTNQFSFGVSANKPASTGFAPAPAAAFSFGPAPTTPATGSFGMPPNSTPASTSFGGGFGSTPASTQPNSFGASSNPATPAPSGFSIGTTDATKKTTGRRIIKARRPK